MRNPAPIILSLLLGVAALIFITRKPESAPAPPAASEQAEQTSASDTPAGETKVQPDPKAVIGELENGFRYIVLPNEEPPGRLSLRLHIDAGSLMEADDQRGLAHFLEHMVFNGSKNFTPDELVPQMQRLGIAFGAHANAYTSFDETVYMLDVPNLDEDTVSLCFTVMRDFADGALLETEEIDRERGVILSEKSSRDSVGLRLMQQQFDVLLPDALVSKRFPIGEDDVIRDAPRERFVDFYTRYYVPSRMTLVAVGDVAPAPIVDRIRNTFESMESPAEPGAEPELGDINPPTTIQAAVFADKEVPQTQLSLTLLDTYEPREDTREERARQITLNLAHSMLGRRFERISKQEGSPIVDGSADQEPIFNHIEYGNIEVNVVDDRWEDAVPVLEQEFRRALNFGFTAGELAEASANLLNAYEQAVKAAATRQSSDLATQIASSISSGRAVSSPQTDLEIAKATLDGLSPPAVHEAFSDFWKGRGLNLVLTTKTEPDHARQRLIELYNESKLEGVEAPPEAGTLEFAYTNSGSPGEVADRREIDDLGITVLQLDNGITVNLKPTDFERNSVAIQARVGRGRLTMPRELPGIDRFAESVINEGGIGEHSADDLQRIFAGRNVSLNFSVEDDHFSLIANTTPDDLTLQLQALAAQIIHPGYRPEAVSQFRKSVPITFQRLRHTPEGPMYELTSWLRGGDPRFSFPTSPEAMLAYEADDLKPWLDRDFTQGPIELNMVGDFDPTKTVPAILATFGALEGPRKFEPLPDPLREVAFPEAGASQTYTYTSKIPQGRAIEIWRTPGMRGNQQTFRRLQLLSAVFDDRLRKEIREKLGAGYSPMAAASGSTALNDYGFLLAINIGTPETLSNLHEVTARIAAELASEGASDDELHRALEPVLVDVDKSTRENGYWLSSVLSGSGENPELFTLARNRRDDISSIKLEEINKLAAEYYPSERRIEVSIISQAPKDDAEVPPNSSDPD